MMRTIEEGVFALLDEIAQDNAIWDRYDLVKRLRSRIPTATHETINLLFIDAMRHDDPELVFTELGALIDLLQDEQTTQVTS